jgi:hypothetical protein
MLSERQLKRHISNIPGWRTNRKIVIIESDDWGSLYIPSKEALEKLKAAGINTNTHYLQYDSFETREDIKALFEVLYNHRDRTGRPPVITAVANVANPNFEVIESGGFKDYVYETFLETSERFEASSGIIEDYRKGINERLFFPIFHGREHLNVNRWMLLLQQDNFAIKRAFFAGVPAIGMDEQGNILPDLRAAFDLDDISELADQKEILDSGLKIFEQIFGFRSRYMVPPNGPFNSQLELYLKSLGIDFIGSSKIHMSPLGKGEWKKEFRYLGKKNFCDQIYLTRNCFFEPSSWEHAKDKDWVASCMEEISSAFLMRKPATISSHRVNYMGGIDLKNRTRGLELLDELLKAIVLKWPNVEFLTSEELGDLIGKRRR